MQRQFWRIFFVLLVFLLYLGNSLATELVWTPINPSFGGSSFNASWLMQQASDQNTFTAPVSEDRRFIRDPLADFQQSLQRQILSRIASQITRNVFGETPLEPGTFEIGTFTIQVSEGTDGVHIEILDTATGGQTSIVVPFF